MDLDLERVLAARPGEPEQVALAPLSTPWGDEAAQADPLPEHPRPRLERCAWTSLNGWWEYAIVESSSARDLWPLARSPKEWDGRIRVPFSPEAPLSGVGRQLMPDQLLWYRCLFAVDELRGGRRLLMHFDAVDYACACYVNGERVGTHVGGYLPFDLDVTSAVHPGVNSVELCVYDPSERGTQLRGKQRIRRGNMWYTAQSGIWQSAWLEEVPARHVRELVVQARPDEGVLEVRAQLNEPGDVFAVDVLDAEGRVVGAADAPATEDEVLVEVGVSDPHLWEPDDPYLYGLRVSYGEDEARSYAAFRTVGVEEDAEGVPRFCLNHRPLFVRGVLDQGYWPDGLMTAPSDAAMVADIEAARAAGFNMLRKHVKIEPQRWYWHCDRLGMLVWQDMVSGGDLPRKWASAHVPTLVRRSWNSYPDNLGRCWRRLGAADKDYRREWIHTARSAITWLSSHPSIACWVLFNESWGQFSSSDVCDRLRTVDGTRPFVATSGWYDQGAGDFFSVHNYFRSMRVYKDPHALLRRMRGMPERAFIIGEMGGLTCPVAGHVSVDTTYGYDAYEDAGSWREALRTLLADVDALQAEGLSGFVYTQLTDVEEETNGLLTYDRRVNKLRD